MCDATDECGEVLVIGCFVIGATEECVSYGVPEFGGLNRNEGVDEGTDGGGDVGDFAEVGEGEGVGFADLRGVSVSCAEGFDEAFSEFFCAEGFVGICEGAEVIEAVAVDDLFGGEEVAGDVAEVIGEFDASHEAFIEADNVVFGDGGILGEEVGELDA